MAKYSGKVGYGESVETPANSGIFVDQITERKYYGDVVKKSRRLEPGDGLNSDVDLEHLISIVADEYANGHIEAIRYVRWRGTPWIVTTVEVERPRLILRLGGVYNGPTP